MADFRRCIFVLAALALLLGTVTTASAQLTQPFGCIAGNGGVPPLLRGEGYTERGGDVLLNCTGGVPTDPGAPAPKVNIQVFLNTSVTSRILNTTNNATEALLLIDEPTEAQQNVCAVGATHIADPTPPPIAAGNGCEVRGLGSSTLSPYLQPGAFNIWQGQLASSNSIVFLGVPIAPPGTQGGSRVFRITNIRGNAVGIGVVGGNASPNPMTETISVSGSTSMPINNPNQIIGYVQQGLLVSISRDVPFGASGTVIFQQCVSRTDANAGTVRFKEGFATSFKTRTVNSTVENPTLIGPINQDVPGGIYNFESGFYNELLPSSGSGGNLQLAGLADFGTRLKINFTGVQSGVTVGSLPTQVDNSAQVTPPTLILRLVSSETGGFLGVSGSTASITLVNGTGSAVYEVVAADPFSMEQVDIPFTISFTANPASNIPSLGTPPGTPSQISGSFAPIVNQPLASATDPVPRFSDNLVTPLNHIVIVSCQTHLLFPYVTNMAGFDTGIAISNTSTDPYGTTPQTGVCTLNFYGDNVPATNPIVLAAPVASGKTWANTALGLGAANFQGYVIADCAFQYAHGFAFVTKVGATDVAMGYLALVIPDPPRSPNPFPLAGTGSGEQLGQ